jgi:protease I
MSNLNGKKILMVIAPKNFRDEELVEPKKVFEQNNAQVEICSEGVKESSGMMGTKVKVDKDIKDLDIEEYSAIVFIGGSGVQSYETYLNPRYLNLAKDANNAGKIVAAICIAPAILANAGLLRNKNATVYSSKADYIKSKGANFIGKSVVVDGNIITGNGPNAAKEFGETIVNNLV